MGNVAGVLFFQGLQVYEGLFVDSDGLHFVGSAWAGGGGEPFDGCLHRLERRLSHLFFGDYGLRACLVLGAGAERKWESHCQCKGCRPDSAIWEALTSWEFLFHQCAHTFRGGAGWTPSNYTLGLCE